MDEALLSSLGFSAQEIRVYQGVHKLGRATPVALAKVARLKRTTAYSIARSLVEKGFLTEDVTRRPRIFTAATPTEVLALAQADKKRLAERERALESLADELKKSAATAAYPVPTVRFVPEEKLEDFLYAQKEVWDENLLATEPTWWGFQDHTFVEEYGEWISWYWDRMPEGMDLNLLSNRAEVEVKFGPKYASSRHIKFWGEAANFQSTLWAIGDYLVMINTRTRPFYLVEIHDKLMAHDQREVFRNLWPLV
jgi:DNA-binding MarR family transcriptional regulator